MAFFTNDSFMHRYVSIPSRDYHEIKQLLGVPAS